MHNSFWRQMVASVLDLPLILWIALGFGVTFIAFFIAPVFLSPSPTMQFYQYIPIMSPIGHDFRDIVSSVFIWIQTGDAPNILYPSFTFLFFAPFTSLSRESGYELIVCIILICYVLITYVLARLINKQKEVPVFTVLILITGLLSYGLQFELERGQWNTIAFAFCLGSVYFFHNRPKQRWLAYLLFSISVQLKLYPAIFVFALIEDWRAWKQNILRIVGLGLFNILALFILGPKPVLSIFGSVNSYSAGIGGIPFSLSVKSFTLFFLTTRSITRPFLAKSWIPILVAYSWILMLLFIMTFVVCFAILLWQAYRTNGKGFDAYIFLACTIGACILPPVSFDYKLSFFPACIGLCMPNILLLREGKQRGLIPLLAFIFSIAYSSTLYSYQNKPPIVQNNFLALFVILLVCTILSRIRSDDHAASLQEAQT